MRGVGQNSVQYAAIKCMRSSGVVQELGEGGGGFQESACVVHGGRCGQVRRSGSAHWHGIDVLL